MTENTLVTRFLHGQLQGRPPKFDADAKIRYLRHYAEFGLKGAAAQAAGVCCQTVQDHLADDEEFAAAFREAHQRYRDKIEQEIHRRSIEGVLRHVTTGKGLIYVESETEKELIKHADGRVEERPKMVPLMERVYSDNLLMMHAKRHIPDYREKQQVELNVTGGVLLVPSGMSVEQWEQANAKPAEKPALEHKP